MENPLVHMPAAWPVLTRANALRRRVQARLSSFDLVQWDCVPYGAHPEQRLHLWELNDLAPRDGWPAVLLIHGGGWVEGSWRDFESLAPALARRGWMAAAMDYRLAPGYRWPAQLDDVLAALDFLGQQQVDHERIGLWGHSAGGHLALMAALVRPDLVRAVVAMGAPTDLSQLDPVETAPVFDASELAAASPLMRAKGGADLPPVLLLHGTLDRRVPVEHARALRQARPDRVHLIEVPDGDHGLRWPPFASLQARRHAADWLVSRLEPLPRASKWRRRKKG